MATKNTAPVEVQESTEAAEPTLRHIVDDGIRRVVEANDIDVQKNRYKAMRAIAWQAFIESIEASDFGSLVERAITNVGNLPSGWEITPPMKATPKATPAKTAPVKKTAR